MTLSFASATIFDCFPYIVTPESNRASIESCLRTPAYPQQNYDPMTGRPIPAAHQVVSFLIPTWHGGFLGEYRRLRAVYFSAVEDAVTAGARTIAIVPATSTMRDDRGVSFPANKALAAALEETRAAAQRYDVDFSLLLTDDETALLEQQRFSDLGSFVSSTYLPATPYPQAASFEPTFEASYQPSLKSISMPPEASSAADDFEEWSSGAADYFAPEAERSFSGGFAEGWSDAQPSYSAPSAAYPPSEAPRAKAAPSGTKQKRAIGMPHISIPRAPQKKSKSQLPFSRSLTDLLNNLDESFSETLLRVIDERGLKDADVYKRANISRQVFSKIRTDESYTPKKPTVIALAVALELSLSETRLLCERAGYALSHNNKFDVIVEYFISNGNYDIFDINAALYAYDQPLLGQ